MKSSDFQPDVQGQRHEPRWLFREAMVLVNVVVGSFLIIVSIWRASTGEYAYSGQFVAIAAVALATYRQGIKLPSGAGWRPMVMLLMPAMFLHNPWLATLAPIPALTALTFRAKQPFLQYPSTYAHVAIGLFGGAYVYEHIRVLHPHNIWNAFLAVTAALFVHFVLNRVIAVVLVARRRRVSLRAQFRASVQDYHWGYAAAYGVTLFTGLLTTTAPWIALLLGSLVQLALYQTMLYYRQLLQAEEAVRQSEKLAVVGQMAAGVAHEIRNPLTSVKGFLQLMTESAATDEVSASEASHSHTRTSANLPITTEAAKRYLDIMSGEVTRMETIVNELLNLGRQHDGTDRDVNIQAVLSEVTDILQSVALMHQVEITFEKTPDTLFVRGDADKLKQVFVNIIKNGIEAMSAGGRLEVRVDHSSGKVVVEVEDEGHGMDEEQIRYLGAPFFTTKENGTGLGWVVSQKIVTAHGGSIEMMSGHGNGSTVVIKLPLHRLEQGLEMSS